MSATLDVGQMSFEVGGKKPTDTKTKVAAFEWEGGEYQKGEIVTLEAQIIEVAFEDQLDKATGMVIGCTRKHAARVIGTVDE